MWCEIKASLDRCLENSSRLLTGFEDMSPEKRSKSLKNTNTDENLPFDIYDSGEYTTRMIDDHKDSFYATKLAVHVTSSSDNNAPRTSPKEYDEDDEEDFISKYTML